MNPLSLAPTPLTRPQRLLVLLTSLGVALTRLLPVAKTPWDWDEILFCLGVDEYDAAMHRPHPPGFPLYVALAKGAATLTGSEFRGLQLVTVVAAMLLFPLLFLLFRELRFSFPTAWSGALLTVFLPNVWLYGGTAFSDVSSLALTVAACAYLLRGARNHRSLLTGALLLGLAAAVRPQALLIGAAPALVAVWHRRSRWREIAEAIALGAAVVTIAYTGAILASASLEEYVSTARKLREYLRTVDSFLSPDRPPLAVVFEFFFVRGIPGAEHTRAIVYAAVAGLLVASFRRDGKVWLLILIFLPFQIFAWLTLDFHSATRYGITYAPMYAVLAAAAVVGLLSWIPGVGGGAGATVVLVFCASLARWAIPAVTEVRRNPSPPARAMTWINEQVPASASVYVHGSLMPYATHYIGGRNTTVVMNPEDLGNTPPPNDAVMVSELALPVIGAKRFVRGRGRIFDIVRQRYFEVTVIAARAWASFGDGWHFEEWHGESVWRWMGVRSATSLTPAGGPMTLTLRLEPVLKKGPPALEICFNGETLDRFSITAPMERSWTVTPRSDGWNELVVTSDRVVNPARDGYGDDTRDLSVRLTGYDWTPAAK